MLTHTYTYTDTQASNKEMSEQWLEGIVSLSLWCSPSSPSPSLFFLYIYLSFYCLSLSLSHSLYSATLFFHLLWILASKDMLKEHDEYCSKLVRQTHQQLSLAILLTLWDSTFLLMGTKSIMTFASCVNILAETSLSWMILWNLVESCWCVNWIVCCFCPHSVSVWYSDIVFDFFMWGNDCIVY